MKRDNKNNFSQGLPKVSDDMYPSLTLDQILYIEYCYLQDNKLDAFAVLGDLLEASRVRYYWRYHDRGTLKTKYTYNHTNHEIK